MDDDWDAGMTHLHRPSLEEDFYSADQGNIFQPFIQQIQHNMSAAVFGYSLDIHWTPDKCPASVQPVSSRPCVLVTHRGVGAGQGHDTQTLSWLLVLARNIGVGGERGNDV